MSVRNKFNEFKKEIKQAYDTDENGLLEISQLSVTELTKSGYIQRRLDSFMFLNEFDKRDIIDFFLEDCSEIPCELPGPIELGPPDESVAEFIDRLRLHAVKCRLWFDLTLFMVMLKEENIHGN